MARAKSRALALILGLLLGGCDAPPLPEAAPAPVPGDAGNVPEKAAVAVEPPLEHQRLSALVLGLQGTAEVRRAGSTEWVGLKIGDPVHHGDEVRTSEDGSLALSIGAARMRVQEGSGLRFAILDPQRVRTEVSGRVEVDAADGGLLELQGVNGGPVASLQEGRVYMTSDEAGNTTLASLQGTAKMTSDGKPLALVEGDFVKVQPGEAPTPTQGLKGKGLSVAWPLRRETNKPVLALQGHVRPWTRVKVQGKWVPTQADGTFKAEVHLHRGRQQVQVTAVDVLGQRADMARSIIFDPVAPRIRAEVLFR